MANNIIRFFNLDDQIIYQWTRPWTPYDITTALWVDASDSNTIADIAGSVSQWNDKSGNSRYFKQSDSATQPTVVDNVQNDLSVIRADGTQYLNRADGLGFTGNPECSVFVVVTNAGGQDRFFQFGNLGVAGENIAFALDSSYRYNDGNQVFGDDALTDWGIGAYIKPLSSAYAGNNFYKNGTEALETSSTNPTATINLTDISSSLFVGTSTTGLASGPVNGDIGEVIVLPVEADTATRQTIEGYLAWKWGLVSLLPSVHPYKEHPPTTTLPVPSPLLWTPADMDTISWYDPSDPDTITEAGGFISQLDDKSGADHHLEQTVGANQPSTGTRTLNGLNIIDGNGTQWLEHLTYPMPASGDTAIFAVAQIDGISNEFTSIFSFDGPTNDFQFDAGNSSQFDAQIRTSGIGTSVIATGGPFPGPSIYNTNFDFSGDGIYNAFIDGEQRIVDTTYSTMLDSVQEFRMLSNRANSLFLDGSFGEVILIESCNDDCRQRVEGYLAWKWGLVDNLPSNHPYKSAAPTI